MDSNHDYINRMEQPPQVGSSPEEINVQAEWVLPSKEDFLKSLDDEDNTSLFNVSKVEENFKLQTEHIFLIAALSGRFQPSDLNFATESEKNTILNALMGFCNIETTDQNVYWLLKAEKRKEVLSVQAASISGIFADLPPTDDFGLMLRQVIQQQPSIEIEKLTHSELLTLSAVLESIHGLDIPKPELSAIKNLLDLKSFIDNYHHLTEFFVGRKIELETLLAFLNLENKYSWDGLVLRGAGGTGKSTLLAKFCTQVINQKLAHLVMIDFDRPGMNPQDTAWLQEELVRQIGIQFPDQKEKLKTILEENQFRQEDFSSSRGNVLESMEYDKNSRRNYDIVREILIGYKKPLLIVLDTLEEVFQQKSFEKLQNWIEVIYQIFTPIPIKVIFSGRIEKEFAAQADFFETIFLDAFDNPSARLFLEQSGNSKATIDAILKSGKIPLRPLELKLVTKILKEQDLPFEVLEKELFSGENSAVSKEYYTGMIYRRVLHRIKDPLVRKIAYPGLILRYITTDLIDVLQPILDLPEMDLDQKNKILHDLESYAWLSYRDNDNEIWHRKDLRRIMIRMIVEQQPELAQKIRKAAIIYFNAQNTPESKAESLYHQLMEIKDKSELENYAISDLKLAADYIKTDDADLPKSAAVVLQFAKTGKVSLADISELPDKYFKRIYEKTGRKLVDRQQFKEAYLLYQRARNIGFALPASGLGLNDRWEQEMLFNLGEFWEVRLLKSYQKSPENAAPLLQSLHYIFPSMLVAPNDADVETIELLLKNACANEMQLEKTLTGPDSMTIVTRLAYSFAIINERYSLSDQMIQNLQQFNIVLNRTYKSGHAERSKLILHTLAYSQLPAIHYMSLANLKLDPDWFKKLETLSHEPIHNLIEPTLDLFRQTNNRPMAARSFLNRIDSMEAIRNEWYKVGINLTNLDADAIYDVTRGPNAILLKSCNAAVYDALQTKKIPIETLRNLLFDCICTNITDLQPGIFEKMIQRNANWLEPLIELIDREQSLVSFMAKLQLHAPEAEIILYVNEAIQRWETAVKKLLKNSQFRVDFQNNTGKN